MRPPASYTRTTTCGALRCAGGNRWSTGSSGPLEALGCEGPLPLGGAKQRALLALLLLNANHVVSRERLIDELWGEDPPETVVSER